MINHKIRNNLSNRNIQIRTADSPSISPYENDGLSDGKSE